VEHLSRVERVRKALDAGVDQFGGETAANLVVELVESGQVAEQRIDGSVRRILRQKFALGLFDNPFVDVSLVAQKVGTEKARKLGLDSQMRAMTLLKNAEFKSAPALPLRKGALTVYLDGLDATAVSGYAAVTHSVQDADVAIIRIKTPWYPVETDNPFARGFHHGDLDFKGSRKKEILGLVQAIPTVVVIYLDRPAVIPEITAGATAVIADFGASDKAVADVLFGVAKPEGTLPFELPASMQAVRDQLTDTPADSKDPLFELGFGLRYE
jgi:beta-glucosidase